MYDGLFCVLEREDLLKMGCLIAKPNTKYTDISMEQRPKTALEEAVLNNDFDYIMHQKEVANVKFPLNGRSRPIFGRAIHVPVH